MWLAACTVSLVVQILLGTQVREAVDVVAQVAPRKEWIDAIGQPFAIHRSFSWVLVLLHVGLVLQMRKSHPFGGFQLALLLLIGATILTGVGMAWYAVPAFLQPVHLLLATICFGVQFLFLLKMKSRGRVGIEMT